MSSPSSFNVTSVVLNSPIKLTKISYANASIKHHDIICQSTILTADFIASTDAQSNASNRIQRAMSLLHPSATATITVHYIMSQFRPTITDHHAYGETMYTKSTQRDAPL